jgi:glycosyltransferase involved in cell wall biosynthesis
VVRVLHYVEHWLEMSSGFVHAHVTRSSYRGVVVSHNATENRQAFPFRPVVRLDRLAAVVPSRRWDATRDAALRAVAASFRVGVVHAHFGYAARDVVPLVTGTRLPFVLSLHGSDATSLPRRQVGHFDPIVECADAVVVPSRFLADVAVELGFARETIHVIPAGVDTSVFTPQPLPADPVVAFVGRLVDKKGIDVLMQAWPLVRAEVPDARLHVLGAGPLEGLVAADQSVQRHVPEPTRRAEQVRALIGSARAVVSPSRTAANGDAESLLLVNLEAQASGRPVVTTHHGGIPEFVEPDDSALLVDEGDVSGLAGALVRVLRDGALAERLGARGPAVAARFDVRDCSARVDEVYDALRARH